MHDNIKYVLNWFNNEVKPKGFTFDFSASHFFDTELLQHPDAKEFGCDPDFNAWTDMPNKKPNGDTNLRVAGGHIHVSYDNADMFDSVELVKLFDLFLGVKSVLIDKDKRRRELYGKAGSFRFKDYPDGSEGFEYRTLSNFWISSIQGIEFIFSNIEKAFEMFDKGWRIEKGSVDADMIIEAINTSNEYLAKNIIKRFGI